MPSYDRGGRCLHTLANILFGNHKTANLSMYLCTNEVHYELYPISLSWYPFEVGTIVTPTLYRREAGSVRGGNLSKMSQRRGGEGRALTATLASFSLTHKLSKVTGTVGTNQSRGGKGSLTGATGKAGDQREQKTGQGSGTDGNERTHPPKGIQIQIKIKTQTTLTSDSSSCFLISKRERLRFRKVI